MAFVCMMCTNLTQIRRCSHAVCTNMQQIAEFIAEKSFRKATGTTAEDDAKAPSVEVPLDFEDF